MARVLTGAKRSSDHAVLFPLNADEVAQVAYELFRARGGAHGDDQQDWYEAERIVRRRRGNGQSN